MEGAKPLPRFPQKAKSNPVAPRAQPQNRERRPADVPAAAISKKLRHDAVSHFPKRKTAPASRSVFAFLLADAVFVCGCVFAGLRPTGNPLIGFPSARQPTGLLGLPFLISLYHQGFRPLRRATKGAAFGICQPFEKGWTENLFLPALRKIPHGLPQSSPRSLSRGCRSPTRDARPRRHGDTPPA